MDIKSSDSRPVITYVNLAHDQVTLTLSTSKQTKVLEFASAKTSFSVDIRNGRKFVQISISTDADIFEPSETMSLIKCLLTNE